MTTAHLDRVTGALAAIFWRRDAYVIGRLDDGTSVKGHLPGAQIGMGYELHGSWEEHERFGRQFKFESARSILPRTPEAIRRYLEENCRWIGPSVSEAIIEAYGGDSLDVLKRSPERVSSEIRGITAERASDIAARLREIEEEEALELDLNQCLGPAPISGAVRSRIRRRWGRQAPLVIRENPYALAREIEGVGFRSADQVAMFLGFDAESEFRVQAAVCHVLEQAARGDGHVCLPRQEVISQVSDLLGVRSKTVLWILEEMVADCGVVVREFDRHEELLYLPSSDRDEQLIATRIDMLMRTPCAVRGEPKTDGLMEDQMAALQAAMESPVFLLTGSAGTGKTASAKSILESFPGTALLVAPTGKAAKRIQEKTGRQAHTIHRILRPIPPGSSVSLRRCESCAYRWEPVYDVQETVCPKCRGTALRDEELLPERGFQFLKGPDDPLDASVIVVDEVSLVDSWLMARFMEAIAPGTRLILVGDQHQLPSVGAGNVLSDLIASGLVPTAELTIIKRQDPGLIVTNSHKIKAGLGITVRNEPGSDFFFLQRRTEDEIRSAIVEFACKRLARGYGVDPRKDIQVISPLREKTGLSCRALNQLLQAELNPGVSPETGCPFRPGDKVIQCKNDYILGLMNGDVGHVLEVGVERRNGRAIVVQFADIDLPVDIPMRNHNLDLAYCLTLHKFQGSESPIVVIPIHRSFGPMVLQRSWVYTGLPRAKRVCVLVGDPEEFRGAIFRNRQQQRWTGLAARLRATGGQR